ncbi:MAG TPA: CRTAC1 family protein, partial [Planctomycetaceae bacterium]
PLSARASALPPAEPLYEDATARAGIDFVLDPGPLAMYELPQIMGGGCAFLDFDQDGKLDIFLVNQAGGIGFPGIEEPVSPAARVPANTAPTNKIPTNTAPTNDVARNKVPTNKLYRQQPDGTFADVTSGSGLDVAGIGMGVAVGDVNNDGFPDICISYFRGTRLFLNRRDGTFADISESAGIDNPLWGTSCVFFDFDRDGWLDLFVANYGDYHVGRLCTDRGGNRIFCQPMIFGGTAHKLFHNQSATPANGLPAKAIEEPSVRFSDASLSSGIGLPTARGLGVVSADFDGDHWPDLFVANDVGANFLWINQHDGTFLDQAVLRGAAYDLNGRPQGNMGIAIGDVDGDGRFDLLVTHFDTEMNALYLSGSGDAFEESAASKGLGLPSLPYTSWGTAFFDVDHDGDLDLAVVNGSVEPPIVPGRVDPKGDAAGENGAGPHRQPGVSATGWERYAQPNQFFLNDGAGNFSEIARATEPFCAHPQIGRGLAIGDVDNDGDLDLLVTNVAGQARLFINVSQKQGHWLQIRVVEPAYGGRDAYGALVTVKAGGRRWSRPVNPASSYLSSNDPRVHFGLGMIDKFDAISVTWADGVEELFPGGDVDRHLVLRRGEGRLP